MGDAVFATHLFGFDLANLNWVEAIWLVVSITGLVSAWLELREAKRDRERAEEVTNGLREARLIVANGYVYRNRIRVGIFSWWVFLGFLFGFFDPPEAPRIAGLLGLLVTAAGFALKGVQEATERRTLAGIIARQLYMDTTGVAADKIKEAAALAAAQLEIVAQEAALRLRQLARAGENDMAADQRRSADAAERTADSNERLVEHAEQQGDQDRG